MRLEISDTYLEVRLARWQKVLGLMRDIRVARDAISEVEVLEDPVREVMGAGGLKVGLRLPWLYYIARSLRLDEAWLVRRGMPALSCAVSDGGTLRRLVISTPAAEALARTLGSS